MDAAQVEVVRALCDDLADMPGVVYAACERRGGATIGEGGDRGCLLVGPVASDLREELVQVNGEIVFRVVYDRYGDNGRIVVAAEFAVTTLRKLLARSDPRVPSLPGAGGVPPPGGAGGAAPAEVGVHDGARKRSLS